MSRPRAACGTESGYVRHHRIGEMPCDLCATAHRDYGRAYRTANRQRIREYDRSYRLRDARSTSPDRAVAHLTALRAAGASMRGVERECGITYTTLREILAGKRRYITTDTESRILAATGQGGRSIDATGTRRRLDALVALGWTYGALGERLGCTGARVAQLAVSDRVYRATAGAVEGLYDDLSMQPGPSQRARNLAAVRGYVPPLAWNDDDIDDPSAWADLGADDGGEVDDAAVCRLVDGYPYTDWRAIGATRADRLEAFARMDFRDRREALKARGYGDQQIDLPAAERVREYLGLRSADVKRPELAEAS